MGLLDGIFWLKMKLAGAVKNTSPRALNIIGAGIICTLGADDVTYDFSAYDSGVAVGAGDEAGKHIEWTGTAWAQKRGWITVDLKGKSGVDISSTLNTVVNTRDGCCVEITDGIADLTGTVTFNKQGVTLLGPPRGFSQARNIFNNGYVTSGTQLMIKHTGKAFRWEQPNCRLLNLELYYPNQNHAPTYTTVGTETPGTWFESSAGLHDGLQCYDYTFSIPDYAHGPTLANLTVHNPYQLLSFTPNGGMIENVKAFPLRRGFTFPRCGAAPHVSNVQFNPVGDYLQTGGLIEAWVKANGTAVMLDGVEGYYFQNFNIFGYNSAIDYFDEDNDGFTGVYGTWVAPDIEACNNIIRIYNTGRTYQPLANIGGKFIGGQFVPEVGGYGVDFQDTAAPANFNNRPKIYLHGTTMHSSTAGMSRAVWLRSTSYGRIDWNHADVSQVSNEIVRNDSTNARAILTRIDSPTGVARVRGVGPVIDEGGEVR